MALNLGPVSVGDAAQMIRVGRDYFYSNGNEISLVFLQDTELLNSDGVNPVPPEHGVVHGTSRKQGLAKLLESPNKYPVGEDSMDVRLSIMYFDLHQATVNNALQSWGLQRETAIRYYWLVHDQREAPEVRDHVILGKNRQLQSTCKTTKVWSAAIIIFHVAYSWTTVGNRMKSLREMGEYAQNGLVHTMLVLPLIQFFCLEMDPYNCLDPTEILDQDLSRLENNIKTKAKNFGVWSQKDAVRRIALPENHEESIADADKGMCQGIEVEFAILFSLVVRNFMLPFDRHQKGARRQKNVWMTTLERTRMYRSLDETYVLARYGQPSGWRV